jgi:molybdopterin synthase catalytic subunit
MQVRVLVFGQLKDIASPGELSMEVPAGSTVESLFAELVGRYPALEGLASSIAIARNQNFAQPGELLADGDEIALLPPVSGGKTWLALEETPEGHVFGISREVLDTLALNKRLLQNCDGALCTFEGVVRDNSKGRPTLYLDYEGYESMAIQVMSRLGKEIAATHEISRIGMIHRLGRLAIGEASVVVSVASPHREAAIAAAREGINRLKKTVPIWKKEYFADGEIWVEGAWDDAVPRLHRSPPAS